MTNEEAKEFIAQSVKSDVDIALVADAIKALEQEPTTKNDLGDLVSSFVEKISEKVTETHEEFIFETIRPYCENVVQMN